MLNAVSSRQSGQIIVKKFPERPQSGVERFILKTTVVLVCPSTGFERVSESVIPSQWPTRWFDLEPTFPAFPSPHRSPNPKFISLQSTKLTYPNHAQFDPSASRGGDGGACLPGWHVVRSLGIGPQLGGRLRCNAKQAVRPIDQLAISDGPHYQ